jgi:hypothetical protein
MHQEQAHDAAAASIRRELASRPGGHAQKAGTKVAGAHGASAARPAAVSNIT